MNVVYTNRQNCPYCEKAKNLLEDYKAELGEYKYIYNEDPDLHIEVMDIIRSKYNKDANTVPQIFVVDAEAYHGEYDIISVLNSEYTAYIGGYSDFEQYAIELLMDY